MKKSRSKAKPASGPADVAAAAIGTAMHSIGKLDHLAKEIRDAALPKKLEKQLLTSVADVVGLLLVELINPLGREYPEHYPQALRNETSSN